jgi:FkbM family methyltransferase
MIKTPLIYDVGMHDGEDSAYYLAKGFDVIGVDADAFYCDLCRRRFSNEIAAGKMRILNLGVGAQDGVSKFFLNAREPALSTFAAPQSGDEWESREIPVRRLSSIIREYGEPHFVKIDVEHYDHVVLRDLMASGVRPGLLSAESHVIDVFCLLVSMKYTKFRLVDGATLHQRFGHHGIKTLDGRTIQHTFTSRSSGPFGEDLPDQWIDKDRCVHELLRHGLGWIDIHAAC